MTWVMPVIRPGDQDDEMPAIMRHALVFSAQGDDVPLTAVHMEWTESNRLRQFARPRRVARRLTVISGQSNSGDGPLTSGDWSGDHAAGRAATEERPMASPAQTPRNTDRPA